MISTHLITLHWQELRNRGQVMKSYRPDQDVDTAFDFLDSYSLREE